MSTRFDVVEIKGSAYRHEVDDAGMLHAHRNAIRIFTMDEGVTMWIGPACDGSLLEVGTNADGDIIHAMPARDKFLN